MKMEEYLYQKDLYLSLGGKTKKSVTMKDEEYEVLNRKALGTIWLCLALSMTFNISKKRQRRKEICNKRLLRKEM